jgi:signal transduction histidine kinase
MMATMSIVEPEPVGAVLGRDQPSAAPPPDRLATLARISHALTRRLDAESAFRTIYAELARVLDASIFILGLHDEANHMVHVVRQVYGGVETPGVSFPLGSGFTSQAIRTRESRLIRHWSAEGPPIRLRYASGEGKTPESGITIPLVCDDQVLGVLLVQSYEPEAYDESDLLLVQAIGDQLARTLANARGSEQLDAQLNQRVSELEAILASMNDALLILDPSGCVVRLNPAARALLSVGDSSIVLGKQLDGAQWEQWPQGPRAVAQALTPAVAALRRGEALRDAEVDLAGTERRVLSFSCAPIHDLDGALAGGVVVFRDVTGRREVERLKDEVLSIASHDLKSPVAAIKGRAQLAQSKVGTGQASPEYLKTALDSIARQADRLVDLLDLLLDFSRFEAGRLELRPALFDLVPLVAIVVDDARFTAAGHRLVLEAPPRLMGTWDERRVEQVVRNLVTNAVKYSPDGGTITINVEAEREGAVVRVQDEGIGLAPQERLRVFDRFYRARGVRQLEGAGLGLYICQAIIAAHGGRIWAESKGKRHGSTFCFTLPRALPQDPNGA